MPMTKEERDALRAEAAPNDAWMTLERDRVLALLDALDEMERERAAYRKAKQENDERFMNERDAARAEVERLRSERSKVLRAAWLLRDTLVHYGDPISEEANPVLAETKWLDALADAQKPSKETP